MVSAPSEYGVQAAGAPVPRQRRQSPDQLGWSGQRLTADLRAIARWSTRRRLPATYSCNDTSVWPTTTKGLSSLAERDDKSGRNALLDVITKCARGDRPGGGRFQVMGDGAYWVESGKQFLAWQYVDLDLA